MRRWAIPAGVGALLVALTATHELGCKSKSCLVPAGEACTVATPCAALSYTCAAPQVSVRRIGANDLDVPGGLDALGAEGDVLLENDRVRVVIDAIDHPHFVAPSGGSILDFVTRAKNVDGLENVFTGTGLLPGDAVRYTSLDIEEGEGFVAVQVRGALDGDENVVVSTRYELRPCEPGVRVRTELVNLGPDDHVVTVTDGWFWGGRSELPFTPTPGRGFDHPSFGLGDIQDVFQQVPFMAAASHGVDPAAYGIVRCDAPLLEGFQSGQISATGTKRRILPPTDYEIYERFFAVADGPAVQPVIDELLEVRRQLFQEPWAVVSGQIDIVGGRSITDNEVRSPVIVYEGDPSTPLAERTPWTQTLPDDRGKFSARVPRGRGYGYTVSTFGRSVVDEGIGVVDEDRALTPRRIGSAARVTLVAAEAGAPTTALVFFHPADAETRDAVTAKLFDSFDACAPLLGPPHGGSPACNRVLVREPVTLEVPPGRYHVYASRGPFNAIAREAVTLTAGEARSIVFDLPKLEGLLPEGAQSADFHVHGGASFDSAIPERDRVLAFLAADVDVIAATEHDATWSYQETIEALGVEGELFVMPGLETTGHILFDYVPDSDFPRVAGHWNFWPMPFDPDRPYRGAPWDELAEPGALFDRVYAAGFEADGVIQLNHPWGGLEFGRDTGFARALGVKTTRDTPRVRSDVGQSLVATTPPGASRSNLDYDVQEVMNGTNNADYLGHRAYWFYLLEQGIVRAGSANSDSHGLTDNVLGVPRNVVFSDAAFDAPTFNAAVKAGRMFGTNGPVIEVHTRNTSGATVTPSVDVFEPAAGAELVVRLRAAPWVPVAQIRFVVNGEVVLVRDGGAASDPFGTELLRVEHRVPLAQLLPADERDAWIVVEAGAVLADNADLDCDGVVDTGDNDGNGVIDWRDVDRDDDDDVDAADADTDENGRVDRDDVPERCDDEVGPLAEPSAPGADSPAFHFRAVTPGGYPVAFTNPLLIDRDGDGVFRGGR